MRLINFLRYARHGSLSVARRMWGSNSGSLTFWAAVPFATALAFRDRLQARSSSLIKSSSQTPERLSPSTNPPRKGQAERWIIALVAALLAAPLVCPPIPPLVDVPGHMGASRSPSSSNAIHSFRSSTRIGGGRWVTSESIFPSSCWASWPGWSWRRSW
jgi:hypothetical protein